MLAAMADTHAIIWYLLDSPRLSVASSAEFERARLAGDTIGLASISVVEIVSLAEKNRIPGQALARLAEALSEEPRLLDVVSLDYGLALAVHEVPREVVPELADRVIAATALHLHVPLISRDHRIQASSVKTIW